ncbi:shikimate kinase [Pollutimonas thiosulfatoxidans]|uniref:Shikimate kinase n=1 Tax=Pollutimonas thiosulfatoxidans TaxID=2028345 RepID=A0A410GFA9_9BURK|nr:shikimate kinase [Candidimonas sp.]NYT45392.1 shikimate kinase [Alcaligenaceae bacterium]QAA94980.1 shikimate kinase [Pollutimonas thiosulfatoxidans]
MNDSLPLEPAAEDAGRHGHQEPEGATLPHDLPVFLVGMMGAGKTTIGRSLARLLGREFVDLDHELEARCGVRVALIFEIEGEDGFRKRETALLDECSQRSGIVLATGGGAILAPENRRFLKDRGVVVYLRASPQELYRRVARDRNRPLLQTPDPQARLQALLAEREPLYESVASFIFETGTMPVPQVLRTLVPLLQQHEVQS